jgi:hypothetical protein
MQGRLGSKDFSQRFLRLFAPSLLDVLFCALLLALCAGRSGFEALLADGDTGWHIRTGQMVLHNGAAPSVDPFSFSRAGQPWFAWEWLSDALFAMIYAWRGMGGVAAFAAAVLCGAAVVLFAWLLRRESGIWVAAAVTLASVSASTIHYLARPHIFSILLYTVSLWLIDEDRRHPSWRVWLLVPLSAVWVNLHGGFVSLPLVLGLLTVVARGEHRWPAVKRYGILGLLCLVATLVNPYGWRLDVHVVRFLNASWILDYVQEFQSPNIRSESMVMFAILLLAGTALVSRAFHRRQYFEGALTLLWGFAAMRSARHIPFYAISAAPLLASELSLAWREISQRSAAGAMQRVFWDLGQELGRSRRVSLWLAFAGAGVLAAAPVGIGFPDHKFPVQAVEQNRKWLTPAGAMPRLLTSDAWADYIIFRLYPKQRVFFDGRSDFYGPELESDYLALNEAAFNWREVLNRYAFQAALLPRSWPLSTMLGHEPDWREVYRDQLAVLCVREGGSR